ncbi:Ankyrin-3, partial [Penicillium rolfsii]
SSLEDECFDAIRKFFDELEADETALFEATTKSQQLLDDLQDVDRKHKTSISRKIAPKLKVFVAGVEQFGSALDIIAGSVSLMSPIWASVRVVLKLAGDYSEYFDKISDMFEEIGYILSCLRRYPRLYPNNQILRESMVEIFHAMMQFCTRARDVFHQGKKHQNGIRALNPVGLHAAWKLIWKPFKLQFGDIMDQIRSSLTRIDHEVDLAEKELANKERSKAEQERQLQISRWDALQSHQKSVTEFIDQQRIDYVNQWLSPVNAASNHTSATKLRYQGTGNWFLDGQEFQQWLSTENSFLWLHAIPGGGKTILASTVIEWLRTHKKNSEAALAYFYCDYKDKHKQSPTRIVSTILSMLASQNNDVFDRIQAFFERQSKENPAYTAEFDELLNNFNNFVANSFETIFIVVDALDESEDRECVAEALKRIFETCKYVKVLVTSRHEIDIARTFDHLPNTTIKATDVAGDIELYVKAEVATKIKTRKMKLRDPNLESVICDTLIDGAHGMFQWVKCQLDQLCKLRNDKAVRSALNDLPKTLHDTYIRILQKVEAENLDDVEIVHRLLKWLVRGVRNLTLSELAECVSIDLSNPEESFDLDAVFTDAEDVIELCGSLITLSSDGHVALAHYTVKEFLVSEFIKDAMPQFWIGCDDVHAELASICLTYLTYDDFSGNDETSGEALLQNLQEYKFLPYAVQAWGHHAHLGDINNANDAVFDLTMKLFESGLEAGGNYDTWYKLYFHLQKAAGQRLKSSNNDPIYFASLFGLSRAVSELLENSPDTHIEEPLKASASAGHDAVIDVFLHQRDSISANILEKCLYLAASQGHDRVVQLLLENGTNVNARGGRQGTPLQVAALDGRHQVVSTLLAHGADLNVKSQRYGEPLAAAAEKGHLHTFQILLDHGANVNARGGWYAYPLVSAIVGQNMQMVDTLIQRGANVNALGGRHGSALMAASSMGMLDLIRSLVAHGARVNDENDKGTDSLYAACVAGNLDSVKLLLELGADVNARGGKHRNALNAASAGNHIEIVRYLLDAGADVDFFEEHYGNSVQTAASAGYNDIIRILVEAGVDINAPMSDRGSALITAAQNGHTETLKLLFELGVPSGDTYEMSNAIMVAANRGHMEAIKVLVENGAAMNDCSTLSTYPCCSPLEAAAVKGDLETVNLLLDLGADVNFVNEEKYGSALIAACLGDSNIAVVERLLNAGADVDASANTESISSALVAALSQENYEICVTLLDQGADPNLAYACYLTPLMMAMKCTDEKFMKLLIDRGADINLAIEAPDSYATYNEDGCVTPLQAAVHYASKETVQKLIDLGADLSVDLEDVRFTTALQVACHQGDVDKICLLIDAGSDVNEIGGVYGTALQAAAHQGHLEATRTMIEAGADINACAGDSSALMDATEEGNLEVVELLIERGANVNLSVGKKHSYDYALTAAAFNGEDSIMEVLIEAGADLNNRGGTWATALQAAAAEGKEYCCELLLANGADPNIVGGKYGTALQAAYASGYYNIIGELFYRNASVDLQGGQYGTALGAALSGSCQTLVSGLLRHHDADPNAPIRKWGTPLAQACSDVRPDFVYQILIDVGANVNARGGRYGAALICAVVHGELDRLMELLEAGADINIQGNQKYPSAVHGAIISGNMSILRLLVEKGADIGSSNGLHVSPVECASRMGDLAMLRYLLKQGADVKPTGKGKYHNALQAACVNENKAIVKALLRHGIDINITGGKFGTALTAAVLRDDIDLAEYLLKKGIDPNAPGGMYSGALQAAAAAGSTSCALLLLRYGADVNKIGGKFHTPLQAAAGSDNYDLVQLLLERGAEVNVFGGHCYSALHAAALSGLDYICELLMKNGAQWSLPDSKLNHLASWQIETATEVLEKCRVRQDRGWPEEDSDDEWTDEEEDIEEGNESEEEDDEEEDESEEDDEEEEDDDDNAILKLNVEAIPFFDLPYRPSNPLKPSITTDENGSSDSGHPDSKSAEVGIEDTSKSTEPDMKFSLNRTNTTGWSSLDWVKIECGPDGDLG